MLRLVFFLEFFREIDTRKITAAEILCSLLSMKTRNNYRQSKQFEFWEPYDG